MLIECLVGFCVFTNCCVLGGLVFWTYKYSYVNVKFIKPLTRAKQNFKRFSIANITMEEVAIILNKEYAENTSPPTRSGQCCEITSIVRHRTAYKSALTCSS